VLGTNNLQKSIDQFDKAVTRLEKVAQQMGGSGSGSPFGSSKNNGGGTGNGGGSSFGGRPTRAGYGIPGATDYDSPAGPTLPEGGYYGHSSIRNPDGTFKNGGNPKFGGQARNADGTFASGGGGAGGNGGGPSFGGSGGQYAKGNGGHGLSSGGGSLLAGLSGIVSGLGSMGESSMGAQVPMSTMVQQGLLLSPNGTSNAVGTNRMLAAAYGSNSTSAPTNNYAFNAADASTGFSALQQMSGSYLPSMNSTGRFGLGAAASFAGANPSMSYTDAVAMAQQMAMPSMSLKMRQMGYGTSPLQMGTGQANSMGGVVQGMMQRWYGSSSTSNTGLAAALAPGQVGYTNLQQLGLSGSALSGTISTMEAYNRVVSGSGGKINDQQVQNLFQQAQGGNKSAISTLNKYGVTQSDISAQKNVAAQKTEGQSDIYNSFTAGLDDASTALGKFQSILNNIVSTPGINQIVGGGMGALGGGQSMMGNMAGGAEMLGGGLMAAKALKLLGGGGGASGLLSKLGMGGGEAATMDAASVGGGGLLAGGGSAAAALGPAAAAAAIPLTLANIHHSNGKNWLQQGPGSPTGGWNSFSGLWNDIKTGWGLWGGSNGTASPSTDPRGVQSRYARGGVITGGVRGLDTQPAMLAKDEAVLNANAAHALGYDNIERLNNAHSPGGIGGNTQMRGGVLYAASGAAILSDAKKYAGHKYVYGGPSNPQSGWDCSSFASYVLGHDMGLQLPGGSWASTTGSGASHGAVASSFAHLPGAHKVSNKPSDIQAGDVLVWSTHVGFGVGPGTMFSAYDTAQGTLQTPKNLSNAGGPGGETLTIMRYGAGGGTGSGSGSGGGTGSGTTGGARGGSGGGSGGYTSTSEASNVSAALGGGGGVSIGAGQYGAATTSSSGSGPTSGNVSTTGGGSAAQNKVLAQKMAQQMYGWSGSEWTNGLLPLWTQESGFNSSAQNPTSTAYGIAQFLDSTWGPYGKKTSNPGLQIKYGLEYIKGRYGDPLKAEAHEKSNNWYATGSTSTRSGLAVVGERGPELVNLPAGARVTDAGTTAKLMGAQGVAQAPWSASSGGMTSGGVSLSFGDINITMSGSGDVNSRQNASNAASEIVSQVKTMLDREGIYAAIRSGNKG
jgi:hypothetical protein